jgi:hypothetical protein
MQLVAQGKQLRNALAEAGVVLAGDQAVDRQAVGGDEVIEQSFSMRV